MKSSLCDYSHAFILSGTIPIDGVGADYNA